MEKEFWKIFENQIRKINSHAARSIWLPIDLDYLAQFRQLLLKSKLKIQEKTRLTQEQKDEKFKYIDVTDGLLAVLCSKHSSKTFDEEYKQMVDLLVNKSEEEVKEWMLCKGKK